MIIDHAILLEKGVKLRGFNKLNERGLYVQLMLPIKGKKNIKKGIKNHSYINLNFQFLVAILVDGPSIIKSTSSRLLSLGELTLTPF